MTEILQEGPKDEDKFLVENLKRTFPDRPLSLEDRISRYTSQSRKDLAVRKLHSRLMHGGIYSLWPVEIEAAVRLEDKFGDIPEKRKIKNSEIYLAYTEFLKAYERIKQIVRASEDYFVLYDGKGSHAGLIQGPSKLFKPGIYLNPSTDMLFIKTEGHSYLISEPIKSIYNAYNILGKKLSHLEAIKTLTEALKDGEISSLVQITQPTVFPHYLLREHSTRVVGEYTPSFGYFKSEEDAGRYMQLMVERGLITTPIDLIRWNDPKTMSFGESSGKIIKTYQMEK